MQKSICPIEHVEDLHFFFSQILFVEFLGKMKLTALVQNVFSCLSTVCLHDDDVEELKSICIIKCILHASRYLVRKNTYLYIPLTLLVVFGHPSRHWMSSCYSEANPI